MSDVSEESRSGWRGGFRFWGRHSALGVGVAVAALAADQLHKYWMIEIYRIAERGRVTVTSYLDLVMQWNRGISYGLLQQDGPTGRLLLIGLALVAVVALLIWMGGTVSRLVSVSLGLIIGGALGNVTDRFIYGAVADFFSFHYAGFYWYVFNIADVAISAGVIGLVVDWLRMGVTSGTSNHQ